MNEGIGVCRIQPGALPEAESKHQNGEGAEQASSEECSESEKTLRNLEVAQRYNSGHDEPSSCPPGVFAQRGAIRTGVDRRLLFTDLRRKRTSQSWSDRRGERGRHVMNLFVETGSVQVGAVCDVYAEMVDKVKSKHPDAKASSDHRKLLEDRTLDAVLIGTPDHWHAVTAIDALNAGKDVYVEKPLTLNIEEGPMIVKAARTNNRICQVGLQQRSRHSHRASRSTSIDALGKITLVRTWWHGNAYHLRKAPATLAQRPSNLDWARFLGPVKWRDWDPQQFWNWRAYLDFGGGQVTDLFTHWIDVVHMFMGNDIPTAGVAAGGVYHYKDGRTAPDTINVLLEYGGEYTVTFEATLAPGVQGYGIEFCGTKGKLHIERGFYEYRQCRARFPAAARGGAEVRLSARSREELPRLRQVEEAAELRCAGRPPLGAGLSPRQHQLCAEASAQVRSGTGRDPASLVPHMV